MIKKAIFGGTFDPIHNGHLYIAYEALSSLHMDKIIFMPSGNPPHKTEKNITDSSIRYEMVKMVARNEKKFEVSNYEINKKGLSYTSETLEYFNKLEPGTEWYFLTGVDCLMELETWRNIPQIFSNCKFIVFNRSGYNIEEIITQKRVIEKKYKGEILFLDIPLLEISSTEIRDKIRDKKNVKDLLPEGIYNMVNELRLYD